ncbi:hypothetical protein PIB30_007201 [Stylosanthes scabra]|uniref:Cupin type-1 domain-containing protein n=1 Tax=Stylosanthes scabra TaxID=79078 RepID=A0ABU6U662_9FABA|nr:hypothetical protein [Stylosanthes scabra]
MEPRKAILASSFPFVLIFLLSLFYGGIKALSSSDYSYDGPLVEKSERRPLVVSEYGMVSAVDVQAGGHGAPLHHLQFITLEPNSLFLPVLLHADMLLYVHTGSGRLTSADEDGTKSIDLRVGDLCKLSEGSVFHIQSNSDPQRKKLRLYAMFANSHHHTYDPSIGAYSRVNELVKGFDKRIIQAAFKVPEDLVEAITNKSSIPGIVHGIKNVTSKDAPEDDRSTSTPELNLEDSLLGNILGIHSSSNKQKTNTYNIFKDDPDFRNRHGWTLTVTKKQLKALKHTNLGFFMVNLTAGSMLGPHWNPMSTEIAVVLYGEGMVRVLCGSSRDDVDNEKRRKECKNMRFKVEEGDVFVVPRFHAMAQMSFKNESLVFLGFSTSSKKHNNVQFLAGESSVLRKMDRDVLATSLGVSNATVGTLLHSENESVLFSCNSCAEEEERIMLEEERRRREEEKEKEEEEAREREREEEQEREEEARRREEEEAARRREEEEREREKEQERERQRQEEEEARRREEAAAAARRREEEEREREREREAAAERAQEEARKERQRRREEEEEEEARRKQQEEIERERQEEARRREFERRRQEAAEREREREEGGRRRPGRGEEHHGGGGWQWEEEEARRQQEEREKKRREGGGGGGYHVPMETHGATTQVEAEGRRVLKTNNV